MSSQPSFFLSLSLSLSRYFCPYILFSTTISHPIHPQTSPSPPFLSSSLRSPVSLQLHPEPDPQPVSVCEDGTGTSRRARSQGSARATGRGGAHRQTRVPWDQRTGWTTGGERYSTVFIHHYKPGREVQYSVFIHHYKLGGSIPEC